MSTKKTKSSNQRQKSVNAAYEKAVEDISNDKKKYLSERFKECHPQAKEISKTYTETVWTDSMQIMQDFPSNYTRLAVICFFSFMGQAIDAYLEKRFQKTIKAVDLPVILPAKADSDMIKSLLERGKKELGIVGYQLLENLITRDFGYLMAVLKALQIENAALHNLLVSGFRFWTWEVMVPHLFESEKKEQEANA